MKIKIYRTIILLVVLYEFGTWFLTLNDEYWPMQFKNQGLRRMSGPKRGGSYRRLKEIT